MKKNVIDIDDVKTLIPQLHNERVIKILLDVLHVTDANILHARHCDKQGADFTDAILHDLGVTLQVEHAERLQHLPEGAFVTVSNHPFGAIDGLINISLFARHRPEYKVMVNHILTYIGAMRNNFIAVEPVPSKAGKSVSMNGLREAIQQVRNGYPIGFFPAGAVSNLTWGLKTEDREWQPNIMRLVRQFKKPVIPIHFYGRNSLSFYFLRNISWKLSSLSLATQLFNKRNKTIRVFIGETIQPEEYAHIENDHELGAFFRAKSFALRDEMK